MRLMRPLADHVGQTDRLGRYSPESERKGASCGHAGNSC